MVFTLPQIITILFPLAVAFLIIWIWYKRDHKVSQGINQEKIINLFSVFLWALFGGFLLKLFLDLVLNFDSQNLIKNSIWFYSLSIFLEEFVKAGSLIAGLELVGKRFNEVSDGIVYGAMSALGFLFLENIFYLQDTASTKQFLIILSTRYFATFGIHLLTTSIFGVAYAKAYLGYKKRIPLFVKQFQFKAFTLSPDKPYAIFVHLRKIILIGNPLWNLFKMLTCWDLFKRLYFLFTKKEAQLLNQKRFLVFPSVFILEGFLFGYYLHLLLNHFLQNQSFGWLIITILPLITYLIYLGFSKLDEQ